MFDCSEPWLMLRSGPAHLPRHHGASIPAVTAPVVSAAATVATAAPAVMTVVFQLVATVLLAAAASPLAVTALARPVRTVSAITTVVSVTGLGVPSMVTAR